jgi:DegV family protein with EDD domain
VRVVVDSTADIPPALAAELDISVVPCQIYLGDTAYEDGLDLEPYMFYRRMASSPSLPRTSQPPIRSFVEIYRRLVEAGKEIVSIHVAGNLSGTINAAWAAAQMLPDPSWVEIIDSGQLSMGLGWAAIQAARMAKAEAPREEIVEAVQAQLPRLRTVAMIDTLTYLYKGGRISQVTAILGTALHLKPLLAVQGGQVSVLGQVRTRGRAVKRLAMLVQEWGRLSEVAVMHTGAEELAESLVRLLEATFPADSMLVEPAGAALAAHLGLGAVGVCALLADSS